MSTAQPSQKKINELEKKCDELNLNSKTLLIKSILGSGRGGQKKNKTETCIYIKHLPTGIEVKCQTSRSKTLNTYLAKRTLCEKIENHLGLSSKTSEKHDKIKKQKKRRQRRSNSSTTL